MAHFFTSKLDHVHSPQLDGPMAQMVSVSTIMTKKNYIFMNSHARVDHLTKPGLRIWLLEDVFIHRDLTTWADKLAKLVDSDTRQD
jgi:hypothetical protein